MIENSKPKRPPPVSYRVPVAFQERFDFVRGELEMGAPAFTSFCVKLMLSAYMNPLIRGAAAARFVAQMDTEIPRLLAEFQKLKESGEL